MAEANVFSGKVRTDNFAMEEVEGMIEVKSEATSGSAGQLI